jgi:putative transposase
MDYHHNARQTIVGREELAKCVAERKFQLHDFVVMPDHLHLLIAVHEDMAIEKAMQLVKGRFAYRLKRECQSL